METQVKNVDHHGLLGRLEEVLAYWADRQPGAKVYTELDGNGAELESLTYARLDQRARALAQELRELSPAGRQAVLAYPAGIEFVVGFFACMYAGLAAVPVPLPRRNRPNAHLARLIAAAEARLVLGTRDVLEWVPPLLRDEPDCPAELSFLPTDQRPAVPGLPPSQPSGAPNSVAFLQFTSGSTSLPKGVMVTHFGCLYNLEMARSVSRAGPRSVFVTWLPHYHDLGLVAHLLHSLYCGGHCVIMAPAAFVAAPLQWLRAISRYRGEYTGAPNFAYQLCADRISEADRAALDLSSLKMAINAAEPINPQTLRDFSTAFADCGFEPRMFLPAYGMAEATVFIASGTLEMDPVYKRVDATALSSLGIARPITTGTGGKEMVGCGTTKLEQEIAVVDPRTLKTQAANVVGEIWVRGANVMAGYYANPGATLEAFGYLPGDARPYLRTGDLGFIDETGELFIAGRMKDLIIVNGANYYPQDIEACVEAAHPALRRGGTAAVGISGSASESLVIFAEVDREAAQHIENDPQAANGIAERICAAVGAQFELAVSNIVFLKPSQLPKTSSGKVRRQECRQRFLNQHPERLAVWPQADDGSSSATKEHMLNIEKALEQITRMGPDHLRVFGFLTQILTTRYGLKLAEFDVEKSIFFYGIDSLNIIDIHARLEEKLNCPLPTVAFFRANTFIEMIDDIVVAISDRDRFDRRLGEGLTLREEIGQAVEQLSARLPALAGTSAGGIGRKALLTGAAGFVGVALLKEILERTDQDVVCMVRAADEAAAFRRIRNTSAKYDLRLPANFERRVEIMIGDMSKPKLGLADDVYQRFAQEVDAVYHCAAIDNFYLPYSVMRKTNVLGAVEVLEFALTAKLKPMFHISSCAASMLEGNDLNPEIVGLVNGYAQSKYVAEQIVARLAERGYPAVNFRLGYLYNLRVQQVNEKMSFEALLKAVQKAYSEVGDDLIIDADAFENFLAVIPEIGAFPDIDADFDMTPVEYAAKAIVETSRLPAGERKSLYSFYNPQPLRWGDIAGYFRKSWPEIEQVPLAEFLERYEHYIRETTKVSVKLLKSVVSPQLDRQLNTMFRDIDVDTVPKLKAWCPPCNARFTHSYVDFAVNG